ncbi:MAG: C1 family peptidase [Victivallaceae bacterium]
MVPRHIDMANVPDTDVSKDIPYTLDQGQEGSCVFHACGVAMCHVDCKLHPATGFIKPAINAPYYQYRKKHNCVNQDTGASGYEYCQIVREYGLGPASLNPYGPATFKTPPSAAYMKAAIQNQLLEFQQIPVTDKAGAIATMRAALHANGFGLPIGIQVPADFESDAVARTGLYMKSNFKNIQGGHEVYYVGSYHNVPEPYELLLNSWGDQWGCKGLNGLRGFVKVSTAVLMRILLEANVLTKTE